MGCEASKDLDAARYFVASFRCRLFACTAIGGRLGESRDPAILDIRWDKSAFVHGSPVSWGREFGSEKSMTLCSSDDEELRTLEMTVVIKPRNLHIRTPPGMPP